jgi:rhamnulokinase
MNSTYLALDLGAESGRAMLGRCGGRTLQLEEVHRFANEPVQYNGEKHWDVCRLWLDMQKGLSRATAAAGGRLSGIGVDTWGVDYALLGKNGALLENPFCYRDGRTDGALEEVFARVPPEEIYARTGIQFMQFNTLFQLYRHFQKRPGIFDVTEQLVMLPDLMNFWLCGRAVCEYSDTTTTQMYDPVAGRWATEILEKLGLPTHMLREVVQPGTVLGALQPEVASAAGAEACPVIAPACHDTGSAVAAVTGVGQNVFLSSGTWSLMGTELPRPLITPEAKRQNFTNEGGVCGTTRFLKNIAGLWLLQCCRNEWKLQGHDYSYSELCDLAKDQPALSILVDPDHPSFLHPEKMPETINRFLAQTEQGKLDTPAATTRAILESLALKYRLVLEGLESLTGKTYAEIHIVGGGSRNALLNQFTADATGRRVVAGPVEATALGNVGMQLLATGAAGSLAEVRAIIERSFPVQVFEPQDTEKWESVSGRFRHYCDGSTS